MLEIHELQRIRGQADAIKRCIDYAVTHFETATANTQLGIQKEITLLAAQIEQTAKS